MPGRKGLVWRIGVCAAALLALLAASFAFFPCRRAPGNPTGAELRIGLLAPLSGNRMRFTADRAALALAERVNAGGGLPVGARRVRVRLFIEDSAGSMEGLLAASVRLIRQDRVQVLVGPYFSREAIPVAAEAEASGTLMLTPTATNPVVTRGRRFVFRACTLDSVQGKEIARFAYGKLGVRRAAVLYDESDAYSRGLARYFEATLRSLPGARVLAEAYVRGANDFAAELGRIRSFGAQALFLPNFIEDLPNQVAQARAAGFAGVFLGGDSWDSDRRLYDLPEAQGARFSVEFCQDALTSSERAWAENLARSAGADLDKNTALTLDSLELIFAAAQRSGGTDSATLRSGLLALDDFSGLTGTIRFSRRGDPARSLRIVGLDGGRLSLVRNIAPER